MFTVQPAGDYGADKLNNSQFTSRLKAMDLTNCEPKGIFFSDKGAWE